MDQSSIKAEKYTWIWSLVLGKESSNRPLRRGMKGMEVRCSGRGSLSELIAEINLEKGGTT